MVGLLHAMFYGASACWLSHMKQQTITTLNYKWTAACGRAPWI